MQLIEAGAHIDTVNASGKTPFEVATTGIFADFYHPFECS